jgi:hypothetical protein
MDANKANDQVRDARARAPAGWREVPEIINAILQEIAAFQYRFKLRSSDSSNE